MSLMAAVWKALTAREEHVREERVWWVTDLCQCREKRRILLANPELERQLSWTYPQLIGTLMHEGAAKRLHGLAFEGWQIQEGYYDVRQVGKWFVGGRPDLVAWSLSGRTAIIELKYSKTLKNKPLQAHRLQVQLYMWLFNASEGYLLYITPEGEKWVTVEDRLTDDQVLQLIEADLTPMWADECRNCNLRLWCAKARL